MSHKIRQPGDSVTF
uniref:Uncharacterized protein n=1 Tax=Anguilla anguilla TaxID=7936 RepID=A0A0E9W050_ANGAN